MALTKKKRHPRFEPLTLRLHGQRPACYPTMFLVYIDRGWYVVIRRNRRLGVLTKKRQQNPLPGDDASTAETTPGRVKRDEQSEARRANATPNGGPRLEFGRLRPKPGLNMISRLLRRHGQHIYTSIYKGVFDAAG